MRVWDGEKYIRTEDIEEDNEEFWEKYWLEDLIETDDDEEGDYPF